MPRIFFVNFFRAVDADHHLIDQPHHVRAFADEQPVRIEVHLHAVTARPRQNHRQVVAHQRIAARDRKLRASGLRQHVDEFDRLIRRQFLLLQFRPVAIRTTQVATVRHDPTDVQRNRTGPDRDLRRAARHFHMPGKTHVPLHGRPLASRDDPCLIIKPLRGKE
ncbi:MAG: hypothetical protein M5R36_26355 [Deltaproteobacteria bacterium]|nr:hypothetical protein [Deltaproteobacteria bacterium]